MKHKNKVIIKVEYLYIPRIPYQLGKGEYKADIYAYLPEEKGGKLDSRFRKWDVFFVGWYLRPNWGWRSDYYLDYRYNHFNFYDENLEKLKQRVKTYIDEEIKKLTSVVKDIDILVDINEEVK